MSHTSTVGHWGSRLNMVTETKSEQVSDGDGRPVVEKRGTRSFHVNSPPSGNLTTSPYMYQIWSSVIGNTLTSILPDGTKFETNIYAGAAKIARHKQTDIEFTSADPVTGTLARFSYLGSSSTAAKEENEPLGQNIYLQDPVDVEPPQNDTLPPSADFPEWQCRMGRAFYGSFMNMPIHCQQQAVEAAGTALPWEDEYSIRQIVYNPTDSPIPRSDAPDSPNATALKYALASTAKPDQKDKKKKGDDDTACRPGRPCLPEEKLRVKIPPSLPVDLEERFDASNAGDNKDKKNSGPKLGKGVPENLKDLVLGLAGTGKCGEVFEQLVKTSDKEYKKWKEKSKDGASLIETMYDSLKSVKINPKLPVEGRNTGGHVELGDYNNDPRGLFATQQRFALITIQETIHQVFDDDKLIAAGEKLYNSRALDPTVKGKVKGDRGGHDLLSAACGRTDEELRNGRLAP